MIASRINILFIAALAAISAFAQFPQAGVEPIGMTCRQAQGLSTNVQTIRTSTYVVDFSRHVIQQGEFLESVERNYNAIGQLESERSFDADGNKLRGTLYQYRDSNLYVSTHLDAQGQRQLLSIARVAVANPPALILDEATSSIDTRTERIVQDGMDKLMHGRTTFVIAHRLSTVRNSDCIMVLEQGRIIERGTHDQLIEEQGRYYQLYTGNSIAEA